MSRYNIRINENITVAYGFDYMLPQPGYFFQMFDNRLEEGYDVVVDAGLIAGIGQGEMLELFEKHVPEPHISSPKVREHIDLIALDLPI